MTKDTAKELLNNPALKLIVLVATVVSSAWGVVTVLTDKIDSMNDKLDVYIATQTGDENIQNLRLDNLENANKQSVFVKPKPLTIEE